MKHKDILYYKTSGSRRTVVYVKENGVKGVLLKATFLEDFVKVPQSVDFIKE